MVQRWELDVCGETDLIYYGEARRKGNSFRCGDIAPPMFLDCLEPQCGAPESLTVDQPISTRNLLSQMCDTSERSTGDPGACDKKGKSVDIMVDDARVRSCWAKRW
jgi:hypothetical protein